MKQHELIGKVITAVYLAEDKKALETCRFRLPTRKARCAALFPDDQMHWCWACLMEVHDPERFAREVAAEDHIRICPKCEREQPMTIVTVDFQCYWCGHREPDNAPLPTVAKWKPAP